MKRLCMLLMLLLAMTIQSHHVFAQSVTITLTPGWNWISVPMMDTLDFGTALGSFTPAVGDMIKSQWSNASYRADGHWRGQISRFYPGYGYKYYSNRTMPVTVTFTAQQPAPQVIVTTTEPTDITTNSAVCGGNVASSNGDYVFVILKGICWSTNPNPTFNDNYVEAGNGLGSFTALMTELALGTTYYVRAFAVTPTGTFYGEEVSFSTDHEYVDLGLPSGNLWATCNIGSQVPEDYGHYFAWGETLPKNTYSWSSYQYCNGSISTITKYCNDPEYGYDGFTDTLTTLQPIDDAASVYWGLDWHMPTEEEWEELYTFTTVTWTIQNGVEGRLFTASNGNSLFLPATGCFSGANHIDAGSCGYYWSSSLYTDNPSRAWKLSFDSGGLNISGSTRWYGYAVRAVHSVDQSTSFIINATANPAEGGEVSGGGTYQEGAECMLTVTANEGYTFTTWTENDEVVSIDANYTFTVNADRTLVANFTNSSGEHTYVDLGLPSGLLWATCNVGADNPEDYGDYFAWGETQPKDIYNWSTYQYCNGTYNTITKYCIDSSYGYNGFTDELTTLLPEDDAATANWGNGWRMPTQAEFQELLDNTTVTWTTQGGVNGRLFTASNGNSLFLPAAGHWGSELYGAGSYGIYWSSSLNTDGTYGPPWIFNFDSDDYDISNGNRSCGFSVRPVCSSRQN